MSKKYCKICGNEMDLGHFGYYCSHTELHPEQPCEAKCDKETITINKEDYEYMSKRDETLTKEKAELQKQLEEKEKLIERLQGVIDKLRDGKFAGKTLVEAVNAVYEPLFKNKCDEVEELKQQLKSQPAEIVEKIRKWGQKHYNWVGDGTGYDGQEYNECIGFNMAIDQLNEILDTILKEYQK